LIEKEKEIYVFRMLQEGLSNVEKHASATACNLSSEELNDRIVFTLKDNGRGFKFSNETDGGLGIKTLRERAQFIGANLGIQSATDKGTIITISIPKK
jgi:signal transduction histidine kinase